MIGAVLYTNQEPTMSSTLSPTLLTYEQLMASCRKTREKIKTIREQMEKEREREREQERIREERERIWAEERERWEEDDRKWREMREQIMENERRYGKLSDRLGQIVVAMVEGGILRLYKNLGYDFDVCNRNYNFGNKALDIYGEVDLFLENGDVALLVEVKTNLSIDDIKEYQDRLEKFRLVADVKNNKRRFIVAVGGGVIQKNVQQFALKQGMFVVQQSGDNVAVIAPKGKPMVW